MVKRFPMLGAILLLVGIVWFLTELRIVTINFPWLPAILIVIAIGIIFNRYSK